MLLEIANHGQVSELRRQWEMELIENPPDHLLYTLDKQTTEVVLLSRTLKNSSLVMVVKVVTNSTGRLSYKPEKTMVKKTEQIVQI